MNKTRSEWSGLYKCCREKRDSLTAFYSLSAAIFVIAVGFYGVLYWVGSKNPPVEPLDEREISSSNPDPRTPLISPNSSAPSSSNRDILPEKKLVINQDDSDDDEILIGAAQPTISKNPNLINLQD